MSQEIHTNRGRSDEQPRSGWPMSIVLIALSPLVGYVAVRYGIELLNGWLLHTLNASQGGERAGSAYEHTLAIYASALLTLAMVTAQVALHSAKAPAITAEPTRPAGTAVRETSPLSALQTLDDDLERASQPIG